MLDLLSLVSEEKLAQVNPAVRFLFALRGFLGRLIGWDGARPQVSRDSFLHRLSAEDHASSLVAPGTPQGPFHALFVSPEEAILEIQNATVHAFSVFALTACPGGKRLYWGIHVRPVGRITSSYMRLIDPFRRWVIYPSVLRYIRATWEREEGD